VRTGTILLELASTDPGSFAFRYPVNTKDEASLPNLKMMNLRHFADVAGRASNFLMCCADAINAELEIKLDAMRHEADSGPAG
jgi:hypothetical protein